MAARARGASERAAADEVIDPDARYEPPECEQHRSGEDREHRSWIGATRVRDHDHTSIGRGDVGKTRVAAIGQAMPDRAPSCPCDWEEPVEVAAEAPPEGPRNVVPVSHGASSVEIRSLDALDGETISTHLADSGHQNTCHGDYRPGARHPARHRSASAQTRFARRGRDARSFLVLEDPVPDPLGDLRDEGVAEGGKAVHPSGNPISHSTHVGFSCPGAPWARATAVGRSSPPLPRRPARAKSGPLGVAFGVGQNRGLTAPERFCLPRLALFLHLAVELREERESAWVGVGTRSARSTALPSSLPLGPGRRR